MSKALLVVLVSVSLLTFSCQKETESELASQILPSGVWIEKNWEKRNGQWYEVSTLDTVEYQFNPNYTGKRTVKSKYPVQVGQPIGSFYGQIPTGTSANVDWRNLSFTWRYEVKDKKLIVQFKEVTRPVEWTITEFTPELITTQALEGKLNIVPPPGINYSLEGIMIKFEKKQ